MTRAEKGAILFGLASAGMFAVYSIIKPRVSKASNTKDLVERRQLILSKENMRILYSTMTFFYLQSYQKTGEDLALLKEVLDVAKPKYVALQVSENELESQYKPILRNPFFIEAMKKVNYLLDTNPKEVENLKELDFKGGLENLYAMHYCSQNNCKIICADDSKESYQNQYEAKMRLKEITKSGKIQVPENLKELYQQYEIKDLDKNEQDIKNDVFITKRSEVFVERIMNELSPSFSLLPDIPYKVLVGVIEPQLEKPIVNEWKNRFLSVYGHQILEGDEAVETVEASEI